MGVQWGQVCFDCSSSICWGCILASLMLLWGDERFNVCEGTIKGIVHPKMLTQSPHTPSCVNPNLQDFISSVKLEGYIRRNESPSKHSLSLWLGWLFNSIQYNIFLLYTLVQNVEDSNILFVSFCCCLNNVFVFDQNTVQIMKYCYSLKQLFSILLYFQMWFIPVMAKL